MFGWEFPPFISGGLGTACYELTRAMTDFGLEVIFVLPRAVESSHSSHVTLLSPDGPVIPARGRRVADPIRILGTDPQVGPYTRPEEAARLAERVRSRRATGPVDKVESADPSAARPQPESVIRSHYGGNLFDEVDRYARMACRIVKGYSFDVIHAHDWMTFPAGIEVSSMTGRPLVIHVHSTEFDRSGENVNPRIYHIEREGMRRAARVITVSRLTRNIVVERYGIDPDKVRVVHNAIETNGRLTAPPPPRIRGDDKIVLFLGRITMQKGPDYFVAAAAKVVEQMSNVRFVMAGNGDMAKQVIETAARLGLARKVLFTGFLRGKDVERAFRSADLFVMPSVSEPFGLVPLEALSYGVPVIISKQSGVAEVLQNAIKVDFWDVNQMADKIVAILSHPALHASLRRKGMEELAHFRWEDAARACVKVYREAGAEG